MCDFVSIGENLAILLAEKIVAVYKDFDSKNFIRDARREVVGKSYTQWTKVITFTYDGLPQKGCARNFLGHQNSSYGTIIHSQFFAILELLKEDEVKFVKKSVANHMDSETCATMK